MPESPPAPPISETAPPEPATALEPPGDGELPPAPTTTPPVAEEPAWPDPAPAVPPVLVTDWLLVEPLPHDITTPSRPTRASEDRVCPLECLGCSERVGDSMTTIVASRRLVSDFLRQASFSGPARPSLTLLQGVGARRSSTAARERRCAARCGCSTRWFAASRGAVRSLRAPQTPSRPTLVTKRKDAQDAPA